MLGNLHPMILSFFPGAFFSFLLPSLYFLGLFFPFLDYPLDFTSLHLSSLFFIGPRNGDIFEMLGRFLGKHFPKPTIIPPNPSLPPKTPTPSEPPKIPEPEEPKMPEEVKDDSSSPEKKEIPSQENSLQEKLDALKTDQVLVTNIKANNSGEKVLTQMNIDVNHKNIFYKSQDQKNIHMGHLTSAPYGESRKLPTNPSSAKQANYLVPPTHQESDFNPGHFDEITKHLSEEKFKAHPKISGIEDKELSDFFNASEESKGTFKQLKKDLEEEDQRRNLEGSPRPRRPKFKPSQEEDEK